MGPLGIPDGAWAGCATRPATSAGFYGVNMRPDDFGRLGELMRRGGVWQRQAAAVEALPARGGHPAAANGCYGWLIWLNAGAPCVGPRITERPVDESASSRPAAPTCTASPGCSASS